MPYKQKTCRSDWAAFVFQSWRRRWCTTMCARIRRSCRAWSTQVFIKQTLQLSVSSKDAYRPWKPRGATSVPAELTCVTKRCVRVLLTWNHFIFCGPLKKKKSCIFQASKEKCIDPSKAHLRLPRVPNAGFLKCFYYIGLFLADIVIEALGMFSSFVGCLLIWFKKKKKVLLRAKKWERQPG